MALTSVLFVTFYFHFRGMLPLLVPSPPSRLHSGFAVRPVPRGDASCCVLCTGGPQVSVIAEESVVYLNNYNIMYIPRGEENTRERQRKDDTAKRVARFDKEGKLLYTFIIIYIIRGAITTKTCFGVIVG